MKRLPPETTKDIALDALKRAIFVIDTSGDDVISSAELWAFIQGVPALERAINPDLAAEMYSRACTRQQSGLDVKDLVKACSTRFRANEAHRGLWWKIVKHCQPQDNFGTSVEKQMFVTTKTRGKGDVFAVTKTGGQASDFRLMSKLERDSISLPSLSTPQSKRPGTMNSCSLSGGFPSRASTAQGGDGQAGSLELPSPSRGGTDTGDREGSLSATEPTVDADGSEGGAAFEQTDGNGAARKLKIWKLPGTNDRLRRREEQIQGAAEQFQAMQQSQQGEGVVAHPFPFQTKFRAVDRLTLKMDKTQFFKVPGYQGSVEEHRFREDDMPSDTFVTKFKVPSGVDLRLSVMRDKRADDEVDAAHIKEVEAKEKAAQPPPPKPFVTGCETKTGRQEMATGKRFSIHEFSPPASLQKNPYEEQILLRRAKKLGITKLAETPDASPDICKLRATHGKDFRVV